MTERPGLDKPAQRPNTQVDEGHQQLEQLLQLSKPTAQPYAEALISVLRELGLDVLFKTVIARQRIDPLFGEALKIVADNDALRPQFSVDLVRAQWPAIREVLNDGDDERFSRVVRSLSASGHLSSALQSTTLGIELADLYTFVVRIGAEPAFTAWCIDQFRQVEKDTWLAILRQNGPLLKLCQALREMRVPFHLPHAYRDALVEFAKEQMASFQQTDTTSEIDVVDLLGHAPEITDFQVRCADAMIHHAGQISSAFYDRFGRHLLAPDCFSNNVAVSTFFQALVTNRDVSGLKWLAELLKRDPHLVDSTSSEVAAVFRDRLRESLAANINDAAEDSLRGIALILNVALPMQSENGAPTLNRSVDSSGT